MSRMKDTYIELVEGIQSIDVRMDQMLHLMKDMVLLEGKIETMEEEIRGRLDKMEASQVDSSKLVDRLIEMSMVVKGQASEAVTHRAQTGRENDFSDKQSWMDEPDDDAWPPPGCDVMDNRG